MDRPLLHHVAQLTGVTAQDRSNNVRMACPLAPATHRAGVDKHLALSVKVDPQGPSVAHCFGCKIGGSLLFVFTEAQNTVGGLDLALAFIKENDRGGLAQALGKLRQGPGGARSGGRRAPADLDRYVAQCSKAVPKYLIEKRGIVKADVERWRIGFDTERERAVFPVWDETGKLVGAARRTIHEGVEPKFFDTPGTWKSQVFYGEHRIDTTLECAHLVEGVLGTIFAARVLPNVLGLLGSATLIEGVRLDKLRRWCKKLVFILDNDQAGRDAIDGYMTPKGKFVPGFRGTLRRDFVVKVVRLPTVHDGKPVKDPADLPGEALVQATRGAEYLW